MDVNVESLEAKVDQVLALCRRLREETRQLRAQVAGLEAERTALTGKIDTARDRLESLKARLPQE
jgi:cell division protein ZapB